MSDPPQRSLWVARVARLAEVEGEQDPDLLAQHRAHLLVEEAVAHLQQGKDIKHLAQASAKILKASLIAPAAVEIATASRLFRAACRPLFFREAPNNEEEGEVLLRILLGGNHELHSVAQRVINAAAVRLSGCVGQDILKLLGQYADSLADNPEQADGALRQLGTDLTARELEAFCMVHMQHLLGSNDPRALPAAHRYSELMPGPACSHYVVMAEVGAGNLLASYGAALQGAAAARQQRSFFWLFHLTTAAASSITRGGLGPTWSWSQVAPFLADMREAASHMRRWMPRRLLAGMVQAQIECLEILERSISATPNRPMPPLNIRPELCGAPTRRCAACGEKAVQMLKCGACKAVFYCNADCQKHHWRKHKKDCKSAAAGSSRGAGGQ